MNNYYTVKEIADWCGVSKPTVQRIINDLNLDYKKDRNRHLYSEEDSQLVCRKLNRKPIETESKSDNETEQNKTTQTAKNQQKNETESTQNENHESQRIETDFTKDEFINFLKQEIEFKNKQLEEKDKQIQTKEEELKALIGTNAYLTKQIELLNEPPNQLKEVIDPVEVNIDEEVVQESDESEAVETTKPKRWQFWKIKKEG